jgi:glutamyl-tRNA synthetase
VEAEKVLTQDAQPVLVAALSALTAIENWTTPTIEEALRTSLIEGLELKPKIAFGPVRVAVTGRRVSPPLFESLEILGRERSLARITAAIK